MTLYYFVSTALPPLTLEEAPEITFEEFMALVHENLTERDQRAVRQIQHLIDLYNLVALWKDEPLDPHGSLSRTELEEAEEDFCSKYERVEDRIRHHGELIADFFSKAIEETKGFLHSYFLFEREWRLVMVALRAKQLGRDVAIELQHEDPHDEIVAGIIAQKDARAYDPPEGFEELREIFDRHPKNPLALHQEVEAFRFRKVKDLLETELFTLDSVLGYMVQLMIVERWHQLAVA